MDIPRNEYPRPQFMRKDWLCLNGEWQFEIDHADTGLERGLKDRDLTDCILVPFCPESELSGVGCLDFMEAVWYRRTVTVPAEWKGRDAVLWFQAVDYETTVWVNGTEIVRHRGGFTPFKCELRKAGVGPGDSATIVVRARDPKNWLKPRGKQSSRYERHGCHYTRTTGIWQSVWMEPVSALHMSRPRITPDVGQSRFTVVIPVNENVPGTRVEAILCDGEGEVCRCRVPADTDFCATAQIDIPQGRLQLWELGNPHLYDLRLRLLDGDGNVIDEAESYAGLRSVTIDRMAVKINGRNVFQRQVLDQGYYPDGIMTAASDDVLKNDIVLSMAAGFNSARLHQKVFEERFLYHADRLGYLVWGEYGDWGWRSDHRTAEDGASSFRHQAGAAIITQWLEVLERDYSHPCIVGWCPLNETAQPIEDRMTTLDDVTRGMFLATKAIDTSRPVLDASGYSHRVPEADIYDCHDYQQSVEKLREQQSGLADGEPFSNNPTWSIPYDSQPFFVSEFGGIWWNPDAAKDEPSWGYGERPKDIEEFYARFKGLCNVLLDDPNMFGYCYTQLTDVFQEQNGIFFFDREKKFDLERIRAIQMRPAAIEK